MRRTRIQSTTLGTNPAPDARPEEMMAYSFVDENKKQALYWRDVGTLDAY